MALANSTLIYWRPIEHDVLWLYSPEIVKKWSNAYIESEWPP
jgi:hypothetical protein